jgi:hypothetical protein
VSASRESIFKLFWGPGIDPASLCSLAGRYDNPIPTRFLAPLDCSKIPAQNATEGHQRKGHDSNRVLEHGGESSHFIDAAALECIWRAPLISN